jgi:hypothetical protein
LALEFLVAFLLTVVMVSRIELASIFRGWTGDHVWA